MGEIKDYKCTYNNAVGINKEAIQGSGIKFPDVHLSAEDMARLAVILKEYEGSSLCEMPFCHTVEAEAMGGIVNLGNENAGPRAKEYITTNFGDLLELKPVDFGQGRILKVLEACKILRNNGEEVVLDISGPFTVLSVLIDTRYSLKALRKEPELVKAVFERIGDQLIAYVKEAERYGVRMFSYADAAGGVNILGPKLAANVVEMFTYDFLKRLEAETSENTLILLCPKTTVALVGTEKAELTDYDLGAPMRYVEGCKASIGKFKFAGQTCVKNVDFELANGCIKEINLK